MAEKVDKKTPKTDDSVKKPKKSKKEVKGKKVKKDAKETEKKESKTVTKKKKKTKKNENLRWYIISTYSGHEKKVANQIMQRVNANELEDKITEVVVPTQDKIVVSGGKKKTVEERILPGYVLVQMEINDDTWHLIRNTEGVTSFIGTEKMPTPLSEKEAQSILAYMDVEQPSFRVSFAVGDPVRVMEGPFADFVGTISEINEDKGQVKVLLSVFGRETPVVLDFLKISKL